MRDAKQDYFSLPLVSIVVPVYNVEDYLDECLEHLIGQTYENIEIVLVDDGSTDESGAKCEEWASRDKRMQVIHQQNSGPAAARNNGLIVASGEFVSFVDGDDCCEADYIEALYQAIVSANVDVACCSYDRLSDERGFYDTHHIPEIENGNNASFTECLLMGDLFPAPWAKIYSNRIACLIQFEESVFIGEDARMWTRLLRELDSLSFCSIDTPLYHYRENASGIMSCYHEDRELDIVNTWEAMCQMALAKFGDRVVPSVNRCRAWMWFEVLDRAIRYGEENSHGYCDEAVRYLRKHSHDVYKTNTLSKRRKLGMRILRFSKPLYAFYRRNIAK